ncbi:hypothetical protein HK102_003272 [Quaeritorhiza haematococci]|nr:hypothetical protein HK102_003272 [Quaeritorhiza haematococci]
MTKVFAASLGATAFLALQQIAFAAPVIPSASTEGTQLHAIPVADQHLPSFELVSRYSLVRRSSPETEITMKMETFVPSLNLDNIPDLQGVSCTNDEVTVSLPDATKAQQWVNDFEGKSLLLMINPGYGCAANGAEQTAFRLATSAQIVDARTVKFTASDVSEQMDELAGEYQISVAHEGEATLRKREDTPASGTPAGPQEVSRGLDFNYSPPPNKIIAFNPSHNMLATCVSCWVRGKIYAHFNVTGKIANVIPKVRMDVSGSLDSNFDIDVKIEQHDGVSRTVAELAKFDLADIEIPGLLTLKPRLAISAGVTIFPGPEAHIVSGYALQIPDFRSTVLGKSASNPLDQVKENARWTIEQARVTSQFAPSFTVKPFKVSPPLSGDKVFRVKFDVTPRLAVDAQFTPGRNNNYNSNNSTTGGGNNNNNNGGGRTFQSEAVGLGFETRFIGTISSGRFAEKVCGAEPAVVAGAPAGNQTRMLSTVDVGAAMVGFALGNGQELANLWQKQVSQVCLDE